MSKITIAIDGHSSTGKSTLAKELAIKLGYSYVDSGAMYRCVALFAMRNNLVKPNMKRAGLVVALPEIKISFQYSSSTNSNRTFLNGEDVEDEIRTLEVSQIVSEVATIDEVRTQLVKIQQKLGADKGVVMDGRDIGTVVFPDAELKIFMTASAEVRAQRRFEELIAKGEKVDFKSVLANLKQRDDLDSSRENSPLLKADGAKVLDNSTITRQEQFDKALAWAKAEIEKANV